MPKRIGQRADNFESEPLPQTDRGFVSRNYEVELHRAIAEPTRFVQRVLAHYAADSRSARSGIHHEAGIGDVVAETRTVRSQNVAAHDFSIVLRDIRARSIREPISHGFFPRRVRIINERIARRDGCPKNVPDRVAIAIRGFSNCYATGDGRFHRSNSPPRRRKSSARCHEKLRYLLAWPKQPQLTSSPRALAAMLMMIKSDMRAVTINTPPKRVD